MLIPNNEDQRQLVTVEQAEADYFAEVASDLKPKALERIRTKDKHRAEQLQKVFGYQNEEWQSFKAKIQPGDELWEYCTSKSSWDELQGGAGYELVRDGSVIASILTRVN